ncbi:MAG TPA: hypothetical protein VIK39_06430 [Candidatus Angelobacter sp.]
MATAKFAGASPELRQNILAFYRDPNAPNLNKKKPEERNKTLHNIEELKSLAPEAEPSR